MSSLSFIKNCVCIWSDCQRPVPEGGTLAEFLVGWSQLLSECLCQPQRQMDAWVQGSLRASCKRGLLSAEMYKHRVLFDQRGILSLASRYGLFCSWLCCDIFIYCPYLSCCMELERKQSPTGLKSADP